MSEYVIFLIFKLLIRYPERNIENTSSMDIVVYSFKPSINSKTDSKENKQEILDMNITVFFLLFPKLLMDI